MFYCCCYFNMTLISIVLILCSLSTVTYGAIFIVSITIYYEVSYDNSVSTYTHSYYHYYYSSFSIRFAPISFIITNILSISLHRHIVESIPTIYQQDSQMQLVLLLLSSIHNRAIHTIN